MLENVVLFADGDGELIAFVIGGIIFLVIIVAIFNSRCPRCKKFFAVKKINDEMIQMGPVYYKTEHVNNQPRRVAHQKNLYRCDYVCTKCGHEWSKTVSRDEKL